MIEKLILVDKAVLVVSLTEKIREIQDDLIGLFDPRREFWSDQEAVLGRRKSYFEALLDEVNRLSDDSQQVIISRRLASKLGITADGTPYLVD